MEKKIKGLMDLNGVYLTGEGMVVLKSEDDISMEILNMGSGFFHGTKTTLVTLNLGKPAITALLKEIGIDVVFDNAQEENKTSTVKSEVNKEKDLQNQALNRLYSELNYCETTYEYRHILSLIERVKRL